MKDTVPGLSYLAPTRDPLSDNIVLIDEPVAYADAWALQSRLHAKRVQGFTGDTVLILEHQPVYTLGRTAQASHWGGHEDRLREQGADVQRVNRGGSVTYHGPGQIVVYPIMQIARHATGPRQWVWLLEDIVMRALRRWQIGGLRLAKKPGMWVMDAARQPRKIASIGIRIEQGVTMHGFALNVDLNLSPFQRIQPCGLADCSITSMAVALQRPTPVEFVKRDVAEIVSEVLPGTWQTMEIKAIKDVSQMDTTQKQRAYART